MGVLEQLYTRLPLWAQHGAVSLYGLYWRWLRFGPGYADFLAAYRAREQFGASAWAAWQQQQLRLLLRAAVTSVPYYGVTWTAAQRAAAMSGRLAELPLLEKQAVRAAPEALLRQDWQPRRRCVFHTSGSSGTPIKTIWTVEELRSSMALREVRSAAWAGVSFGLPRATFSGRLVEPNPLSSGPFYRYNRAERQVYLSPFHLRPEHAPAYVHALRRHRVQWLTGYAGSYYLLAQFILEQQLAVPPLRALITTSEKLSPQMRQVMEQAYGCRVYEEYSTVEQAIFASECEHGRLHVNPDVALVEILRPDGSPCAPGEIGEVVTTGLLRQYQPLIRYRLGDLAAWAAEPCGCGRAMPVLQEVAGRSEELVVSPDGRRMLRFHGLFTDQPHVREGQVIQETIRHITLRVVPTIEFSRADIDDLVQRVQQRLGPEVSVGVEPVSHIPRMPSGKFRAVVSLLADAADDQRASAPTEGPDPRAGRH